tara:strand:+ start:1743 stop:2297 length:555 start_codon:yes stop_codon:yes gene_type:complete
MKQSENVIKYEKAGIDPFSAPPAGYSLTQVEGKWPWEKPPTYTSVDEAYEAIIAKMKSPEERMDILNLMEAGLPIETIVRTITFTAFTKGLISPDLAELVTVPLSFNLLLEARKAGITPKFNNNPTRESIPFENILELMSELNPKRFEEYLSETEEEKPEQPLDADTSKTSFMNDMKKDKNNGD